MAIIERQPATARETRQKEAILGLLRNTYNHPAAEIAELCPVGSQSLFDSPVNEEIADRDRRDI